MTDAARALVERRPLAALLAALAVLTLWRFGALALAAPPLYFDEAQYWFWAQDPAFGYYSKPPLIAWAIAASTTLFGDGMLAVRLPTMLCYPAAATLVFLAAQRLYSAEQGGARIALLAGLAYATLPTVSFYSWAATTDALLVLSWATGTYAMVRLAHGAEQEAEGWRHWLLLGAAVGVGALAKYAMFVFGASAATFVLLERRELLRRPQPFVAAALAALIVAPNVWWNAQLDFPTVRHTAEISHLDDAALDLKPLLEFVASQFAVFGPIMMGALVALLFGLRRGADPRTKLLLWLALPMLGIILVQALLARAFANWAQAAYVPLTIVTIAWLQARGARRLLVASFALHLGFAAFVYHLAQAFAAFGVEPPRALDLSARMRPWPPAGAAVVELLRARPEAALLADEREVLSELAYYARDASPELAAWNPERKVSDHYRLLYDLDRSTRTRFVVVSRKLTRDDLAPRFERVTELAPIVVAARSDRVVTLRVFEAERFLGY